ncbi:unnamed protein product [Hermetia illucens]|uniref:Cytochrome P450 n=1 Tax=Hermetia illucens TaxID=343691 RepID=A0A7R8YSH0_HERIL|nr:probable cytochrome P450 6a23 [Hermetia illucens]CAD7083748.1 unnamed protein product [Hermetia illucens]
MDFLVLIVGVLIGALVLVLWMEQKFTYWRQLGVPYEEPDFFYGNLKGVDQYQHDGLLTQKFYEKFKGKGPFVGVYFFLKPVAIPTDIELVKNILIKDFNFFHDRGLYYNERDDPLSAHLLNLQGLKWKQIRTQISPTFSSGKMKMMFTTMARVAQKFENKIEEVCKGGAEVDAKKLMARFAVDVIGTCAFGLETNSLEDDTNEYFRLGLSVFDNPRHGTMFMMLLLAFQEYARKFRLKFFRDEVINFYTKVVRDTVRYRLANNVERDDFMQLLIKLHTSHGKDNLSFNDLLAQAFVFHVGGVETSATTLQFCFYELARNPDLQSEARNHINEVLRKHNGELTYEALKDMKYLEQVILETLRKYPPAGTLVRETTQDYKIPGTKFILEKGTCIFIPAYAIHHDPEFYPNPLKFNPENFSVENVKDRPSASFLTFGEGPRRCIGARFGMIQVKLGVIAGLRRFRYSVSSKTKEPLKLLTKALAIQAEGGIWLNIESMD